MLEPSEELTIRGSLSESSIPELLASIGRSGETGILNFHDAGRWKATYFKNGRIIYALSNASDDRLGEFLIKDGKITVRQFLDASKQMRPGKKFGAVLVEQEVLSADDLVVSIHRHVEAIVYSLFHWTRGEYEFVMKELEGGQIVLDLDTENVILEGIRRLHDYTRIFAGVGPLEAILRLSENADSLIYRLELDEDEQQVLSLVNGRLDIEQIVGMSYLNNFETLRILFALVAAGVLERGVEENQRQEIELEYELQEVVDHYNRNFEAVSDLLRDRLGPRDVELTARVTADVATQFPLLLEGVELGTAGRVDFDQLLQNLGDKAHEAKKAVLVDGLNELTYALLLEIGRQFGKEDQEKVATRILSQPQPGMSA